MQNGTRAAALLGALARISQAAGNDLPPTDNVIGLLAGQTISVTSLTATVCFLATQVDAYSLSHCARILVSSTNGRGAETRPHLDPSTALAAPRLRSGRCRAGSSSRR